LNTTAKILTSLLLGGNNKIFSFSIPKIWKGYAMTKRMKSPLKNLIRNKEQLFNFALKAFGFRFSRHPVCANHTAQLDFVWDVYSQNVRNAVVIGSRMSGKTTAIAFLHSLFALTFDFCESVSIASTKTQSKQCYDYVRRILTYNPLFYKYVPPPQSPNHSSERLVLHNGSMIRILTATEKGLNAPHPNKVFFDEVDLIDWNVLQQGLSLAKGNEKAGILGQQIFASSWKKSFGPLTRLTRAITTGDWGDGMSSSESIKLLGGKVYRWCFFDIMKRCKDKSWCEECKKIKKKLSSGEEVSFFDICQGRGLFADGFLPREEALVRFIQLDEAVFRSEWLSEEPTPLFAVFSISPLSYLSDWDWKKVAGSSRLIVGVDIGTSAPTVFLLMQVLPSSLVVVFKEIRKYHTSVSSIVEEAKRIAAQYQPECFVIDPRATMVLRDFQLSGLRAFSAPILYASTAARTQEKLNRIRLIQSALDTVRGIPRLYFVVPHCEMLLKEMKDYAFETDAEGNPTDKLPDGNDDGIDALAYAFSFMEASGYLRRDVPADVLALDFELIRPYLMDKEKLEKVDAGAATEIKTLENEIIRQMREYVRRNMEIYQQSVSVPGVQSYPTPRPEDIDDKMMKKMHELRQLYELAQSSNLPVEERAKIAAIAAEIEEELKAAWTKAEIQSILATYGVGGANVLPFSFTDLLFRP